MSVGKGNGGGSVVFRGIAMDFIVDSCSRLG